ncbi:MAG TPA: NADH-quinone oxidoreductase subunit M [Bacteroidia bacterium]|nr:NADH-quinone oxidoreductase subunit M [Bacteroidia bacterium]
MLTAALIALPLLASLILFTTKGRNAGRLALFFSILEFALAVGAFMQFRNNPGSEVLRFNAVWVSSLNIHFEIAIDALSLLLVLLSTFLVPLIILSSFSKDQEHSGSFYGLILLMQMALVGVFVANDGFLFYVFWELALIPVYFICLLWGGEHRGQITFKFFVYTLFGSLFMLIGLIYLYSHSNAGGHHSWQINDLYAAGKSLNAQQQSAVFWLIFIAFAIKMPIIPFHTWQPDTYVVAPTQGTMLLSGIMLKMATFGAIRWLLPMVPIGLAEWGPTAIALSVTGIVYASLIAMAQKDFKRLIAYSSIAHVGLISAGILTCTQQGIQGAIMQMLAHGVNVVGLFLIADILMKHTGTRDITRLGGIRSMNGNFSVLFLIILLGAVALPLTNGFVGEFLLINGVYQYGMWTAVFAGLSVILGAVYMLRSYQGIMLGERKDSNIAFGPLDSAEKTVLIVICITVILFGVYPKPLNDIADQATREIIMRLK